MFRVVALVPDTSVNNLQVLQFGSTRYLEVDPVLLNLEPWFIRWIERK